MVQCLEDPTDGRGAHPVATTRIQERSHGEKGAGLTSSEVVGAVAQVANCSVAASPKSAMKT
jgi:hypothetical protein